MDLKIRSGVALVSGARHSLFLQALTRLGE